MPDTINAFKNGVTAVDADNFNPLLNLLPFKIFYQGSMRDSKTGTGVMENNLSANSYCCKFTLNGVTEIERIAVRLDRDGNGADLTVEIRDNTFNPVTGVEGNILKSVLLPAEFVLLSAEYISIPIGLTGLVSGGSYWIVIKKAGDASNKIDWVGQTSQDGSYPAYRRSGDAGIWTATNALYFYVYSGKTGLPYHVIEGGNSLTTITYSDGLPQRIFQYIPPADGPAGGIRDAMMLGYVSGVLERGDK